MCRCPESLGCAAAIQEGCACGGVGVGEGRLPCKVTLEFTFKGNIEISRVNGTLEGESEQIFLEDGQL